MTFKVELLTSAGVLTVTERVSSISATDASGHTLTFNAPYIPPPLPYEINAIISYGQSNAIGAEANAADTAFSTASIDGLTMPGPQMNQGVEFTIAGGRFQDPVAAVESDDAIIATNETPCRGSGEVLLDLIEARQGLAFSAHQREVRLVSLGNGGESLEYLRKEDGRAFADTATVTVGTKGRNWAAFEEFAQDLKARAVAAGQTCGILGVQWHHGADPYTNSISKADYKSQLSTLVNDLQDVATYLGQSTPIYLYIVQSHAHFARNSVDNRDFYVAEAQAEVAEENANALLVQPQYANLFLGSLAESGTYGNGSSVHHRSSGSKVLGGMCGYAAYVTAAERRTWWNFLPSAVVRVDSTTIRVDYDVPADYQLEWTFQTDQSRDLRADPQLGFYPVETGTTTTLAIKTDATSGGSHLPYIDGNSVYITMDASLPATCDLTYGPDTYGGNLCVKPICAAAEIPIILQGGAETIFRHAPLFRMEIPA